jgi:4-hydroxybenzoate polyprenyltransferase
MTLKSIIQLLRPTQWSKNAFVFLPLFFSGQLFHISMLLSCLTAFAAFSLAASSIYCFNDIYDIEADKLHPKKCKRPIASGAISVKMGYFIMAFCLISSMSILYFFGGETKYMLMAFVGFYILMNIAYCVKLKHFVIIDVIIISTGFVLRVLVGGIAANIWLSEWIVIMTFLLALFLAFAKRRDDVIIYQKTGISARKKTKRYNLDFMNQVITVISTITIIAYLMYTLSPEVIERFKSKHIYLTAIFVLMGIIRYLQLTIVDLNSGSPTNIFLKDRFIHCCIAGWIISFLIIIYI